MEILASVVSSLNGGQRSQGSESTAASAQLITDGGKEVDNSDDSTEEVGGFVFGQVEERTDSNPSSSTHSKKERRDDTVLSSEAQARLVDLVKLQPTKNKELQERWNLDSGSEVHQYLESELKSYYYRDENSLIRATDGAEQLVSDEPEGSTKKETSEDEFDPSSTDSSPDGSIDLQERDLVIELVSLTQEMGRLPTASEVNDQCQYTHQEYREVFGSLVTAYKQAGIVPEDVSEVDLTAYATGNSADKNESEVKSTSDTSSSGTASSGQNGGNAGDVTANPGASSKLEKPATQEQVEDNTGQVEVTKDALIKEIQRFAGTIDEPPTEELVTSYGEYELTAYEAVFDSWDQALEEAGFDPADVPDWSDRKYTNAEILNAISDLAEELGHPPTTTEMNKYGDVTGGIGSLRFGSWANAIRLAGHDSDERSSIEKARAVSNGQSGSSIADSEDSVEEVTGTSESTDANAEESNLEELTNVSGVLESDAVALAEAGYTSREALKEASVDELQKVEEINLQLALRIKADVED